MKKSLLAVALIGAFSGAAFAQSSVTVYGVADAGIQSIDKGAVAGSELKLQSGQINGSRLGFKGVEDLGNGLKANFVLEMGLNIDDGSSGQGGRTFGRRSTVGLSGDFGAIDMGRDKTTLNKFVDSFDPFGSGFVNSGSGLGNGNGARNSSGVYYVGASNTTLNAAANSTGRSGNTLFYYSPNISGFNGSAQYSFGEVTGDTSAASQMGINVGYKAAGLNVGYAYFKEDKQAGSTIATNFNEKEAHTVAASYDFGMIKPVAIYQQVKEKSVVNPAKLDTFTVGATVVINPVSRVIGTYSMIDDKSVNAANLEIGQTEQFALGYSYDLSKRTSLYASLAYTSQDARAQKLGAAVAGADVKEYVVGVRHSF